jgi:sarcosine oxidase, subunit alpha
MSERLKKNPCEVIDRSHPVTIHYQGRPLQAFEGDTVATALYAAGMKDLASSFKYHRPRGIFDLGVHATEPMMEVDGRPNARIARIQVRHGMRVAPQKKPGIDLFKLADKASGALEVGFYYKSKTLIKSKAAWNKGREMMRTAPGNLGEIKPLGEKPRFEEVHATPEVLVVGGGAAGLEAALTAAGKGVRVILIEAEPWLGGFERFQGSTHWESVRLLAKALKGFENVSVLNSCTAAAAYPDGLMYCIQSCGEEEAFIERSWLIRPGAVVVATGAIDRPLIFNNNDRPGVILPQAAQRLLHLYGIRAGQKVLAAGGDEFLYKVCLDLARAGVKPAALVDFRSRSEAKGDLGRELEDMGVEIMRGFALYQAKGRIGVSGVEVSAVDGSGSKTIACDSVIAGCGRTPLFKLLAQAGALIRYDPGLGMHLAHSLPPGCYACGRITGQEEVKSIRVQGRLAGARALAFLGLDAGGEIREAEEALKDASLVRGNPAQPKVAGRKDRRFIDTGNDVTEKDMDQALAEGFLHTEMIKRYTTATMSPEQGAYSQANFLDYLARSGTEAMRSQKITTPRAPLVGMSLGVLGAGLHDQPRLTPLHHVQMKLGGRPLRTGPWIRVEHFGAPEEESLAVRRAAGICDVSTLGKFRVFGPDADKLLNRVHTKGVEGLDGNKILYTATCNEEGVIVDDGIIIKRDDRDYYVTTSTARAPLAREWYGRFQIDREWKVWVANLTDAYGGMNLAGPRSREILSSIIDTDISNRAAPYMRWVQARVACVPCLVFRMGFLGELSYEIHCPASQAAHVWQSLLASGKDFGLRPVGLETQICCRLEKGHVLPGLDTDGNTTLFGAHFGWLRDKDREDMVGGPMLRLLEKEAPKVKVTPFVLDGRVDLLEGYLIVSEEKPGRVGHITSVRYSPTLDKTVGLALVEPHKEMDDTGKLNLAGGGREFQAKIVATPFYDPKGERLTL